MPIMSTILQAVLNRFPNKNNRLEASRVKLNQDIGENDKNKGPKSRSIVEDE